MPTLLLIHGGWCGSGVWKLLKTELQKVNVAFKTVDLPGHDVDGNRFLWNVSLDHYADSLIEVAEAIQGPIIAVAHSMGGLPMTVAANRAPQIFSQLIYLAAFAPVSGERFMNLARGDKESLLGPGVRPNPWFGSIELNSSVWHDALFHDCSEEDERYYSSQYCGTPLRPALRKLLLSDNVPPIQKSYVLCSNDRALSPNYQRWMADRSGIPIEHKLPSGHMAMLAIPTQLAQVLADYARNV